SDQAMYVFPASFIQEGLWFIDQLEPGGATYNIPVAILLRRVLDLESLERSLNAMVQRHEALRTTLRMQEGQLVQVIAPSLTIPLAVRDLRGLAEAQQEAEAQRVASEEAQRPFELAHGPLVRAAVVQLGAQEHLLLVTMHHIVSDGWSMGVFVRELATLY